MQNWEAYLRAALRDLVRVRLTLRDLVRVGVGVTVRDGEGVRDAVREGVTVEERKSSRVSGAISAVGKPFKLPVLLVQVQDSSPSRTHLETCQCSNLKS